MPTQTKITGAFASAMQQLSAEAETLLHPSAAARVDAEGQTRLLAQLLAGVQGLNERMAGLEAANARAAEAAVKPAEAAWQFAHIEEQLTAIRSGERVHQQLFDSLHQELIRYRDNFLLESLQKPFIRDLLVLFDDLTQIAAQLETASLNTGSRGPIAHMHENLINSIHFLVEVLHRLEVTEMETRDTVQRDLHRVISYEPADFVEEDGQVVARLKRGFMWRGRVLRPEEVIAKKFQ